MRRLLARKSRQGSLPSQLALQSSIRRLERLRRASARDGRAYGLAGSSSRSLRVRLSLYALPVRTLRLRNSLSGGGRYPLPKISSCVYFHQVTISSGTLADLFLVGTSHCSSYIRLTLYTNVRGRLIPGLRSLLNNYLSFLQTDSKDGGM